MTFSLKGTENYNFTNNQYETACGILSLLDIFYTSLTSVLNNLEHGLAKLTESFSPSELHKLPC